MAVTAPAIAEAMSQPMIRMARKPMTLGTAAKSTTRPAASEVSRASPQLRVGVDVAGLSPRYQVNVGG
jgi:hypothetical protein